MSPPEDLILVMWIMSYTSMYLKILKPLFIDPEDADEIINKVIT